MIIRRDMEALSLEMVEFLASRMDFCKLKVLKA